MVGLKYEQMTASEPLAHKLTGVSQVRHDGYRSSAPGKPEGDGIVGIMGEGKRINDQVLKPERGPSRKLA
jgi:hypothetical protein